MICCFHLFHILRDVHQLSLWTCPSIFQELHGTFLCFNCCWFELVIRGRIKYYKQLVYMSSHTGDRVISNYLDPSYPKRFVKCIIVRCFLCR
jgi:hypothetical protein